jgi:hypothetical protein
MYQDYKDLLSAFHAHGVKLTLPTRNRLTGLSTFLSDPDLGRVLTKPEALDRQTEVPS